MSRKFAALPGQTHQDRYGIISGNIMTEGLKKILLECPAAYRLLSEDGGLQAEGQAKARLAGRGLTLFPESGEALVVTYRNILAFSAGAYSISLSSGAWLDVIQDGEMLKPMEFSGVTDCEGIRKVVKFDLSGGPFAVQISGAAENSISFAVLPVD